MNKLNVKQYIRDLKIHSRYRAPHTDGGDLKIIPLVLNAVPLLLAQLFGKHIQIRYFTDFYSTTHDYYKAFLFRGKIYESGFLMCLYTAPQEICVLEKYTVLYYKGKLLMTNIPELEEHQTYWSNETHSIELRQLACMYDNENPVNLEIFKPNKVKVPVLAYVRAFFHSKEYRWKNIAFLKSLAAGNATIADDSDNLYYSNMGVYVSYENVPFEGTNWIPVMLLSYFMYGSYSAGAERCRSLSEAFFNSNAWNEVRTHIKYYTGSQEDEDAMITHYPQLYKYTNGITCDLPRCSLSLPVKEEVINVN